MMFRKFYYLTCSLLLIGSFNLYANPNVSDPTKKYELSICAIFKNEAQYLKGWIDYHRFIGVDHFYLYNIGSIDSYTSVLYPYILDDVVTLVNWPEALNDHSNQNPQKWALSTQIPAYENAINFVARDETKWIFIAGIDEFLLCPDQNIKEVLSKYDDFSAIVLSSDYYDASNASPLRNLPIQPLDLTSPPSESVDKEVAKMIFKPDHCAGFYWPPYQCRFPTDKLTFEVESKELRINRYLDRNKTIFPRKKKKNQKNNSNYRILLDEIPETVFYQSNPIYLKIPDFFKKIGIEK